MEHSDGLNYVTIMFCKIHPKRDVLGANLFLTEIFCKLVVGELDYCRTLRRRREKFGVRISASRKHCAEGAKILKSELSVTHFDRWCKTMRRRRENFILLTEYDVMWHAQMIFLLGILVVQTNISSYGAEKLFLKYVLFVTFCWPPLACAFVMFGRPFPYHLPTPVGARILGTFPKQPNLSVPFYIFISQKLSCSMFLTSRRTTTTTTTSTA